MTALHPKLQEFYIELDPGKRCELLTDYMQDIGSSCDDSDLYRVDLFNARYPAQVSQSPFGLFKKQKSSSNIKDSRNNSAVPNVPGDTDLFLKEILFLLMLCNNTGFFPARHKKEVLSAIHCLQLDERPLMDSACEEVLYYELRNVIRRYFSTCHHSSYGPKILGFSISGLSGDEEKERRRCIETWNFSFGAAKLWNLNDEMAVLCRAANDEYCASVPDVPSLESAYRSLQA